MNMEARTVEGKESRNQRLHTVGSPGKSVGAKWGPEITKKAGRTRRVLLPKEEAQRKGNS